MAKNNSTDYQAEILACIPKLRRYARALCKNNNILADDLVQDCLTQGLSKFDQWSKDSNLRAWLFTIMHNLFVNQVRKYKHESPNRLTIDHTEHVIKTPDSELEFADIEQALEKLEPDQQSILLLVTLEDMTYQNVAELLDIPVGTVMSRLSRARARLRDLIYRHKFDNIRSIK